MKRAFLWFVHVFLFAGGVLPTQAQSIVITNVTVIDGTGAPARAGQSVLIQDGKIAFIGRVKAPKAAQRIDGSGKFLIPGLWDMHTHVAGISADPKWGKHLLPIYLAHGIVGIRDMAGDLDSLLSWKNEQANGKLVAPRMIVCGPFLDGSTEGFKFPTDAIAVTTPEAARTQVRELKRRGADFIKVGSRLSPEVLRAIAEESKAQGLTFAGHVPDDVKVEDATNEGMRSMEHMFGMLLAVSGKADEMKKRAEDAIGRKDRKALDKINDELEASYSPEKAAALAGSLRKNGTWLVPTLVWTDITSRMDKVEASPMLALLPKQLQAEWAPDIARSINSPRAITLYARKLKNDMRLLRVMADSGVPILAGSDSLDPYVFPGDSLWRELELLHQAGLTPMQALQAATRNPAIFLGQAKVRGTIERGKAADLVLLESDPLADLSQRPRIAGVFQDGKFYSREQLQGMVGAAMRAMNAVP